MEKFKKPNLFNLPLIATGGMILGILEFFTFVNDFSDNIKIIILFLIIIIIAIINIIIYYHEVNKLYESYQKRVLNHEALSKQFDDKKKIIEENNKNIKMYKQMLYNLYNVLYVYMNAKTENEKQKIKDEQIAKIILDLSTLRYIDGGNNNE